MAHGLWGRYDLKLSSFPVAALAEGRTTASNLGVRHDNMAIKEQISLDEVKAKQMLEKAREHVGDNVFVPMNSDEVDLSAFLEQYPWVIYVSGFRNAVVDKYFDGLKLRRGTGAGPAGSGGMTARDARRVELTSVRTLLPSGSGAAISSVRTCPPSPPSAAEGVS